MTETLYRNLIKQIGGWKIEEIYTSPPYSTDAHKTLWYEASMIDPQVPEQCGHYPFITQELAEEFIESKKSAPLFNGHDSETE
jgi:hypothetical protein